MGQSFDGDAVAVDGATDEYAPQGVAPTVVTTRAMAEGAIEGVAAEYALAIAPFGTDFRYSRFDKAYDAKCAPRDVTKLTGTKRPFEAAKTTTTMGVASSDDYDEHDEHAAAVAVPDASTVAQ
jgi:hypothetical protein